VAGAREGNVKRAELARLRAQHPTDKHLRGLERCADYLRYCLSIGWSRASLDSLEALWWADRDRLGNLRR
jgi:hypothetical protein